MIVIVIWNLVFSLASIPVFGIAIGIAIGVGIGFSLVLVLAFGKFFLRAAG